MFNIYNFEESSSSSDSKNVSFLICHMKKILQALKRSFFSFILLFSCLTSFADKEKTKAVYTETQIQDIYLQSEKLKNTTLLVIIDDAKSSPGKKLTSALEKNWNFNPYKIVKSDSIDQYIANPKYSILTIYYENSTETDAPAQGYYLGVFIGDEKNKTFDGTDEFISLAIPGRKIKTLSKRDSILKENTYLFNFFIKNLNNQLIKAHQKTNSNVITSSKNLCTYYDSGKDLLANKTILICQEGIDAKFNPKAFIKNFNLKPEQLKIVEKKEIESAINKQNEKIAFGYDFSGGKGKIFDASTGTLLAEGFAKGTLKTKILAYSILPAFIIVLALLLSGYK